MNKKLFKVDTNKEAFDVVEAHLKAQGSRCGNDVNCYYDGDQASEQFAGMKCAIGAIMTNEALYTYGEAMQSITSLIDEAISDGWDVGSLDKDLLRNLQTVHDDGSIKLWPEQLAQIAKVYL